MTRRILIADIKRVVARRLDVPLDRLDSECRVRPHARARQMAMFVAVRVARRNYSETGRYFARDHSTAMHAERRVVERMASDPRLRRSYRKICRDLVAPRGGA